MGTFEERANMINFLTTFINSFNVDRASGTRIGLITFAGTARLEFPLLQYADNIGIITGLRDVVTQFTTEQAGGIVSAIRLVGTQCITSGSGDRINVPNLAVIVAQTDMVSAGTRNQAIQESRLLQSVQTRVLAVGISPFSDKEFARQLSSPPQAENQDFFSVQQMASLLSISGSVASSSCRIQGGGGGVGKNVATQITRK